MRAALRYLVGVANGMGVATGRHCAEGGCSIFSGYGKMAASFTEGTCLYQRFRLVVSFKLNICILSLLYPLSTPITLYSLYSYVTGYTSMEAGGRCDGGGHFIVVLRKEREAAGLAQCFLEGSKAGEGNHGFCIIILLLVMLCCCFFLALIIIISI